MKKELAIFKSKEAHLQQIEQLKQSLTKNHQQFSLKNDHVSNTLRNGEYKKKNHLIDLSLFNGILAMDLQEKWILVEPRVTFEDLCQFTLRYDHIPLVVPEFKSITVGGAVMGSALESSAHLYGQVSDTCLEYECLLGNGELICASPSQNSDLFYGCSASYGTLALLTAIKLEIKAAKKWVELSLHFTDVKQAVDELRRPAGVDFIEAMVFNQKRAVVIAGNMIDKPYNLFRQNHYYSPWYVQYVLRCEKQKICMPIFDYLFRLDRGAFWIGRYAHSFSTMMRLLLKLGIPKIQQHNLHPNFIFRFLFGWAFSSKRLYKIWHRVPNSISETLFFIHDFYTPIASCYEVLQKFMQQTEIFPIWLCPIKGTQTPQFLSPHLGETNFINIGLYGIPHSQIPVPQLSALLEKEIIQFGGKKMLYSFTYYDYETFSRIYNGPYYQELRKKYAADKTFPELFDKIANRVKSPADHYNS